MTLKKNHPLCVLVLCTDLSLHNVKSSLAEVLRCKRGHTIVYLQPSQRINLTWDEHQSYTHVIVDTRVTPCDRVLDNLLVIKFLDPVQRLFLFPTPTQDFTWLDSTRAFAETTRSIALTLTTHAKPDRTTLDPLIAELLGE